MQNDQSDLELIFKKRARRRLVGAIALALLMVIVLPILLKDRTKTAPQEEIAIVMPNSSSETALNDSASAEVDGATIYEEVIELPKPEATTLIPTPVQRVGLEQAAEINKSKEAPEVVTPKVIAQSETKPQAITKPVEQKPVMAKEIVTKASERNSENQFYVQIGVFSDPDNVKKLEVKLNELGYRAVNEKIVTDKGVKTRLRTTSFTGKNEAVIALQNIKDAGLTGMVVSQK